MREHDAFRICGGARSIGNVGQCVGGYQFCPLLNYIRIFTEIFFPDFNHFIEENLIRFHVIDRIENNVPFHGLELVFQRTQFRYLLIGSKHHTTFRMIDSKSDILFRFEFHRKGNTCCSSRKYSQLTDHPIVFPFRNQSHTILRLQTHRNKSGSKKLYLLMHLAVGHRGIIYALARFIQIGIISVFGNGLIEHLQNRLAHKIFLKK